MQTKWGANIVLINSPYYKKNYLESERTAIVPGIVEVPNIPKYLQTVDNALLAFSEII